MFGIGSTELLIILLVALIVLGPGKLADVSRKLGRAMGEFRKVSNEFQRSLNVEAAREEQKQKTAMRANQKAPETRLTESRDIPDDAANAREAASENPGPLEKAIANARREAASAQARENPGDNG